MTTKKFEIQGQAKTEGAVAGVSKVDNALNKTRTAAEAAGKSFDKTASELDKTEKQASKLAKTFGEFEWQGPKDGISGMASASKLAAAGLLAIGAAATGVIVKTAEVAGKFESLKASLKTATGSTEAANKAFGQLQKFAASTPFQLDGVTTAFLKLKNLGLDSSERALRSYGDTSASLNKNVIDMVEAVADATTGEFERLKEFGIKASAQGDRVAFTFRGMTTVVRKEAGAIEDYLIRLGETNFAGAMADQSATLNGMMSNLEDNVANLFAKIGEHGLLEALKRLAGEFVSLTGEGDDLAKTLGQTLGQLVDGVTDWVHANKDLITQDLPKVLASTADILGTLISQFVEGVGAIEGFSKEIRHLAEENKKLVDSLAAIWTWIRPGGPLRMLFEDESEFRAIRKGSTISGALAGVDFSTQAEWAAEDARRRRAANEATQNAEIQAKMDQALAARAEAEANAAKIIAKKRKSGSGRESTMNELENSKFTTDVAREMAAAEGAVGDPQIEIELERRRALEEEFTEWHAEQTELREDLDARLHEERLKRLAQQQAAQEAAKQKDIQRLNMVASAHGVAAQAIVGASGLITSGSKKANKAKAALEAVNLSITAVKYGIEGAADIAAFNYVQGAGKLIAAGIATAGIAKVIAEGTKSSASGGGGRAEFSEAFHSAPGAATTAGSSSGSSGSTQSASNLPPISHGAPAPLLGGVNIPTFPGTSQSVQSGAPSPQGNLRGGGIVINANFTSLLPMDKDAMITKLRQEIDANRRNVSGGL